MPRSRTRLCSTDQPWWLYAQKIVNFTDYISEILIEHQMRDLDNNMNVTHASCLAASETLNTTTGIESERPTDRRWREIDWRRQAQGGGRAGRRSSLYATLFHHFSPLLCLQEQNIK